MTYVTAPYEIESPLGIARGAEVLASEQSSGSFGKIAHDTDALRARHGARIDSLEVRCELRGQWPPLPSARQGGRGDAGVARP